MSIVIIYFHNINVIIWIIIIIELMFSLSIFIWSWLSCTIDFAATSQPQRVRTEWQDQHRHRRATNWEDDVKIEWETFLFPFTHFIWKTIYFLYQYPVTGFHSLLVLRLLHLLQLLPRHICSEDLLGVFHEEGKTRLLARWF